MATFGTDDFIIDDDKKTLVQSHFSKIDHLFNVKVAFDVVSNDGSDSKQWIVVSGNLENRRNAKGFILALCNPEHICHVGVSGCILNSRVLEEAERQMGVFIESLGQRTAQIRGSLESCTMAISQLERTYRFTNVRHEPQDQLTARAKGSTTMSASAVSDKFNMSQADVVSPLQNLAVDCGPEGITETMDQDSAISWSAKNITEPGVHGNRHEKSPTAEAESSEKNSEAEIRKEKMHSYGLQLGFGKGDIEEALQYFDFDVMNVHPAEFMKALDAVRSSRQTEGSREGSSTSSALDRDGSGQSPAKSAVHKGGKGKKQTNKGRSHLHADNSVSDKGPQTQATHSSPCKNRGGPTLQRNGGVNVTATPIQEMSLDDSVIFTGMDMQGMRRLGEDLDASVILVDAFPVVQTKPRIRQDDPGIDPMRCGHKRKELFSDDEDQTFVLRPYDSGGTFCDVPGSQPDIAAAKLFDQVPSTSMSDNPNLNSNDNLRFVVIDGSNVAMSHGNDRVFSCKGIQLCVDYFVRRGHRVKAWVPMSKTYRNQPNRHPIIKDQHLLDELKSDGHLGFTPSRKLNNKFVQSHDDLFILELAEKEDAVIVSNDNFREFNGQYGHMIGTRVLSFVFSDDHFMLPRDPLGRYGPTLEEFLCKTPVQPSRRTARAGEGPKPSFGFFGAPYSPRFGLRNFGPRANRIQADSPPLLNPSLFPIRGQSEGAAGPVAVMAPGLHLTAMLMQSASLLSEKTASQPPTSDSPPRHPKVTNDLLEALQAVFPGEEYEERIQQLLENHPAETDLNRLTNYLISILYV